MAEKLIILDRDGVINEDSDDYIKSPEEWRPVPGSIEAIARLYRAGYRIAVATNQSGLARGYFSEYTLANIHNLMCALVEEAGGHIDALCYCPHHPDDDCRCRKPAPGLLEQIGAELDLDIAGAYYVGDSRKDIELARNGGCVPVLVRSGKGRGTEQELPDELRDGLLVFDSLAGAADFILASDSLQAMPDPG